MVMKKKGYENRANLTLKIIAMMRIKDDDDEKLERACANSGKGAVKGGASQKRVIRFIATQRMKAPKKIAKIQKIIQNKMKLLNHRRFITRMLRFDLENVSATGCDLLTAQVSLVPRSWNSRLRCDAIQNVMPYKM